MPGDTHLRGLAHSETKEGQPQNCPLIKFIEQMAMGGRDVPARLLELAAARSSTGRPLHTPTPQQCSLALTFKSPVKAVCANTPACDLASLQYRDAIGPPAACDKECSAVQAE